MSRNQTKKEESPENPWFTGLKVAVGSAAALGAAYLMVKGCEKISEENTQHTTHTHPGRQPVPIDEGEKCVVCLNEMKPLQHLSCGHVFHENCVSTWLNHKPTCPLCREQQIRKF